MTWLYLVAVNALAPRRAFLAGAFTTWPASAAVIDVPLCTQGQGPGCEEFAGDSALLRDLQEKSRARKAEREAAALDRYNYNNFADYFAAGSPPRRPVKHKDGKYEVLTDAEIDAGVKAGKIGKGSQGTPWSNYAGRNPYYFIE